MYITSRNKDRQGIQFFNIREFLEINKNLKSLALCRVNIDYFFFFLSSRVLWTSYLSLSRVCQRITLRSSQRACSTGWRSTASRSRWGPWSTAFCGNRAIHPNVHVCWTFISALWSLYNSSLLGLMLCIVKLLRYNLKQWNDAFIPVEIFIRLNTSCTLILVYSYCLFR